MEFFAIFFFSSVQAFISTILSLFFALPLAHFFYRFTFPGRSFFLALASLLCIMPTKLIVLSISQFFGVDGFSGIVFAHLMLNIPFCLYVLNLTYNKLDMTMLFVASDLGASSWQRYRDIVFPFLLKTIISMGVILFLLHSASFSIPLLLGGKWYHNTPDIMMSNLYNNGNWAQAFLYWILRVTFFLPLMFLHSRYAGVSIVSSDIVQNNHPVKYKLLENSIWWLIYGLFISFLTVGPFVALLLHALDLKVFYFFISVASGLSDSCLGLPVCSVVLNSLLLAIVSAVFSVLIAFLIGSFGRIARHKYSATIVSLLMLLPFIFGSVGVGILFAWFSYGKIISAFLIGVMCHAILNYPFAYRIIAAQLSLYHSDLHKSACSLGATRAIAIRTVTFPFVRSALIKAFCIAFGLSLTEVGAGSVLQNKMGLTIPMAIRIYRKAGLQNELLGLSVILLALVLVVSYFLSRWVD